MFLKVGVHCVLYTGTSGEGHVVKEQVFFGDIVTATIMVNDTRLDNNMTPTLRFKKNGSYHRGHHESTISKLII